MNGTLGRDMLWLFVIGFIFMVVVMLPLLNPPTQKANAEPPGNVIATIVWPPGNTDIDLWVDGPGELVPVGYSNKGGLLWNLLRDDLGKNPDATPLNYENAYTRGITAGEYTINVHCYRCPVLPQKVEVEVARKSLEPGKSAMKTIAVTSLELTSNGQELTALRFTLDSKGNLVSGSMHSVFRPLRSAKKE